MSPRAATQASNAKLGPPLVCARYRETAASQRSGQRANVIGAMRTLVAPTYNGCRTLPIKPWSWKNGAQPTTVDSWSCPNASAIIRSLAIRLPCETITPLGTAVDPDVYWRNAIESGAGGRGRKASPGAGLAGPSTGTQHAVAPAPPARGRTALTSSNRACGLSTAAGWQSPTMLCVAAARRPCLGGFTGTATSPAYRQAKNATTKSRPGGNSSSARSPGEHRTASSAAAARARWCSSP